MRTLLVSMVLLFLIVPTSSSTLALEKYQGQALEWSVQEAPPLSVRTDETFNLVLSVRNEGTTNLTGGSGRTTVELALEGGEPLRSTIIELRQNQSTLIRFNDIKISREGTFELRLNAFNNNGQVRLYNTNGQPTPTIHTIEVEFYEEPFNWTPIVIIIVVVAAIGGVVFFMNTRKKKAEAAKKLEDEARRQDMIRKKEAEIAKKIEVKHVVGKQPRDYYILRRQKYSTMRPSGMTSSGLTILKHVKTKAEIEAEEKILCPKCGTELSEVGEECPRCIASEKIEGVRHSIRRYKSQANVDFSDAETLLRKAEHRLNWSDFSMSKDIVDKAEAKMEEIWEAAGRGQVVESTVTEYAEEKGPSLDAKLIALEGEETPVASPGPTEDVPSPVEQEPVGEPCPECGQPMIDDECLLCTFSESMDSVWSVIEAGELDGAKMAEAAEMTRKAASAKERGSEELAVRYLRQAITMADEVYHSHALSKTEGIVQFTKVLIGQVKSMGEDASMAEQMMSKADAAMEAGQYEDARSMAGKADGLLKQMKEDSYRKRITELMPTVEAGASSDEKVQELLTKAKKLIDAGEVEGAVDLLEAASSKL
jgi:hypothetical protein